MRGPIEFMILKFTGNCFNGKVLDDLNDAVNKRIIDVLDIALIYKNEHGKVSPIELSDIDSKLALAIDKDHEANIEFISQGDIDEVAELLDLNSSASLLIIEQLWAKDFKETLIKADGILLSEGFIHPDAAQELDEEEEN